MPETRPTGQRVRLVAASTTLRPNDTANRDWVLDALCREDDPDRLFVVGSEQRRAATLCRQCPVMQQCAADALDNKVEYGIWGGMTERERRALLKKHPDVVSWSDFLDRRKIRSVG